MIKTILTIVALMGGITAYEWRRPQPAAEPSPPPASFGKVRCEVDDFVMVINDRPEGMNVRTRLMDEWLERDNDLSDGTTHVAAITDGLRTVAVTLNARLETTITVINDTGTHLGEGKCHPLN